MVFGCGRPRTAACSRSHRVAANASQHPVSPHSQSGPSRSMIVWPTSPPAPRAPRCRAPSKMNPAPMPSPTYSEQYDDSPRPAPNSMSPSAWARGCRSTKVGTPRLSAISGPTARPLKPGAWSDRTISPVCVSTIPATAMPMPRSGDAALAVISRNRLVNRPAIRSWFFLVGRTRMAALRRDLPAGGDHGSLRAVREHENCADRPAGAGEPDRSRPLATTCPAGQRSLLFKQPFIEERLDDLADRRPGGAGQPRELRPGERAVGVEGLQHPSTVDLAGPGGGQHRRLARRSTGATGLRDLPSSNRDATSARSCHRVGSNVAHLRCPSSLRAVPSAGPPMEPPGLDPWFVCTTNNPSPGLRRCVFSLFFVAGVKASGRSDQLTGGLAQEQRDPVERSTGPAPEPRPRSHCAAKVGEIRLSRNDR